MDLEESMLDVIRATMEAEAVINALYDRAPRLSHGEDSKKVVKVAVGRNGELEEISIGFEWERKYRSHEIEDAIMEAVGAAYTNQLAAISNTKKSWIQPVVTQDDVEARLTGQADRLESSAFFKPSLSPVDAAEELIALAETLQKNRYKQDPPGVKKPQQSVTVEKYSNKWISKIYIDSSWARGRSATGIASAVLRAAKTAVPEKSHPGTEKMESMLGLLRWIGKEGADIGKTATT